MGGTTGGLSCRKVQQGDGRGEGSRKPSPDKGRLTASRERVDSSGAAATRQSGVCFMGPLPLINVAMGAISGPHSSVHGSTQACTQKRVFKVPQYTL